jgi:hypothetical protein
VLASKLIALGRVAEKQFPLERKKSVLPRKITIVARLSLISVIAPNSTQQKESSIADWLEKSLSN